MISEMSGVFLISLSKMVLAYNSTENDIVSFLNTVLDIRLPMTLDQGTYILSCLVKIVLLKINTQEGCKQVSDITYIYCKNLG